MWHSNYLNIITSFKTKLVGVHTIRQGPLFLGQAACTYHAIFVSDSPVEFFSLYDQKVFTRFEDATLCCDGACCVDVVTGHHTYCDTSSLTLLDCRGYLHRFQINEGQLGKIVHGANTIITLQIFLINIIEHNKYESVYYLPCMFYL